MGPQGGRLGGGGVVWGLCVCGGGGVAVGWCGGGKGRSEGAGRVFVRLIRGVNLLQPSPAVRSNRPMDMMTITEYSILCTDDIIRILSGREHLILCTDDNIRILSRREYLILRTDDIIHILSGREYLILYTDDLYFNIIPIPL